MPSARPSLSSRHSFTLPRKSRMLTRDRCRARDTRAGCQGHCASSETTIRHRETAEISQAARDADRRYGGRLTHCARFTAWCRFRMVRGCAVRAEALGHHPPPPDLAMLQQEELRPR